MSRRDEIIEAAFLLFLDKGLEQTSLNDIIKKGNISNGGFYHHFKSKESLIIETINTYIYFHPKTSFDDIDKSDKSTKDKIKVYLSKTIGYDIDKQIFTNVTFSCEKIDYKKLNILFFSSFKKYDLLKDIYEKNTQYIENFIKRLIDSGVSSGEIKKDVNSSILSSIIFTIFIGNIVYWMVSDDLNLFDMFSKHLDYAWEKIFD